MIADLKPYAEYKESGLSWLGQVPGHWEVRKLKQVSQRFWAGGTPQSGNDNFYCDDPNGYPWLMISDLTRQRRVRRTRKRITEAGRASRGLEILPVGTVLYSMYASLGTASVLDIGAAVNQAIIGISPRAGILSSDFVLYSLEQIKTALPALASSSTQANLNAEKVKSLQICLPPPAEQAAIVRFLDWANGRLERAIRAKRKVIALLNEQKQAIIHRAVTRGLDPSVPLKPSGIPWLGDIPQHWEVRRTKFIVDHYGPGIQMGPFGSSLTQLAEVDTGFKLFGQENTISGDFARGNRWVTREQFEDLRRYELLPGDIVLTRKGSIGKARLVPPGAPRGIADSDTIRVRLDKRQVEPTFIVELLHTSTYVKRQIQATQRGAVLGGLNTATIGNLALVVPPLPEQLKLLVDLRDATKDVVAGIGRIEREIELLREYRTRLVADVVTGKLDVREAAARLPDEAPSDTAEDDTDPSIDSEAADEEAAV